MSLTASAAPAAQTAMTSLSRPGRSRGRRDDLDVVAKAVGEQRTYRAIDLARAEHAVFGGPAFALDVAARILPAAYIFSS